MHYDSFDSLAFFVGVLSHVFVLCTQAFFWLKTILWSQFLCITIKGDNQNSFVVWKNLSKHFLFFPAKIIKHACSTETLDDTKRNIEFNIRSNASAFMNDACNQIIFNLTMQIRFVTFYDIASSIKGCENNGIVHFYYFSSRFLQGDSVL